MISGKHTAAFGCAAGIALSLSAGCGPTNTITDTGPADVTRSDGSDVPGDVPRDVVAPDGPGCHLQRDYCSLGQSVPGATVPAGYCIRTFAQVNSPRALVVSSCGDLFVAAPSFPGNGGSHGGVGAILVLTDDNNDGNAEVQTFLDGIPDVHGLAMGQGYVYYTTSSDIFRVPLAADGRTAAGPAESLAAPSEFGTGGRWTHGLSISPGGQLYASRGEYASCGGSPAGTIYSVTQGNLATLATGFRNPMYIRCHSRDELCVASELGEDQTTGAREKLVAIRSGTQYGYPCCFTTGLAEIQGHDCSQITTEEESIPLSDTPFGLDWERGHWGGPYTNGLFVALHGSFYHQTATQFYDGAAVVYYPTDATTHLPSATSFTEFVGGFGHQAQSNPDRSPMPVSMSRPADIAFDDMGRMFIADDTGNYVYVVAPVQP